VNIDLLIVLPRPTARLTAADKLEFSSKDRSENSEARHALIGLGASNEAAHPLQVEGLTRKASAWRRDAGSHRACIALSGIRSAHV
jgi:hypothetical protein